MQPVRVRDIFSERGHVDGCEPRMHARPQLLALEMPHSELLLFQTLNQRAVELCGVDVSELRLSHLGICGRDRISRPGGAILDAVALPQRAGVTREQLTEQPKYRVGLAWRDVDDESDF